MHVGEVKAGEPIISLKNLPGLAGSVAILSLRKVLQRELVQGLVSATDRSHRQQANRNPRRSNGVDSGRSNGGP